MHVCKENKASKQEMETHDKNITPSAIGLVCDLDLQTNKSTNNEILWISNTPSNVLYRIPQMKTIKQ